MKNVISKIVKKVVKFIVGVFSPHSNDILEEHEEPIILNESESNTDFESDNTHESISEEDLSFPESESNLYDEPLSTESESWYYDEPGDWNYWVDYESESESNE